MLHLGKSMQADLYFITHTLHVYMDESRCFIHKIAPEKSNHERENSIFKPRKYFIKTNDLC